MRQILLSQVEQALPAIMTVPNVEGTELPVTSRVREGAGTFLHQRKKIREGIAQYEEQARYIRTVIDRLRKIDAAYMAPPIESDDTDLGQEIGEEDLRRVLKLFEVPIAYLEGNNEIVFPAISRLSAASLPVVRLFKKVRVPKAHLLADDVRDWMNAIIAACEASRDLLIALKVIQTRIETEITGRGSPAESVEDVDQFLAECWT